MLTWSCEQVRAELSAFYDEELPVADRIAISDHLDGCPSCRLEADDLAADRRGAAGDRARRRRGGDAGAQPPADRHPASAGTPRRRASFGADASATCSTIRAAHRPASSVSVVASLCLAMGAFLLAQSPIRHPESLKAAMTLSSRARTADIYLPAVEMLPRAYAEAIMPATVVNRDDEEVAFAALVTADGYLEEVELIGDRIQGRRSCRRTRSCQSCSTPPRPRASSPPAPPARPSRRTSSGWSRTRPCARRCARTSTCACAGGRLEECSKAESVRICVLPYFGLATSPRAVAELFFASYARMMSPLAASRIVQRQLELLVARSRRCRRADRPPASAARRASIPPSKSTTTRRGPRTGSSCGRWPGATLVTMTAGGPLSMSNAELSSSPSSAAPGVFDASIGRHHLDDVRAVRHRRRVPHEDRFVEIALQRLPRRLAFAAIQNLVPQLVVVGVFGAPHERLQAALIGAAAERRRCRCRDSAVALRMRRSGAWSSKPAMSGSPVG